MAEQTSPERSFLQVVLGERLLSSRTVRRFLEWPETRRVVAVVAAFSTLLYLPYLGAVGLFDPWESHYGEVAREMMVRNNYVVPFWESAPFFSKPPLLMWLDVLGMAVVGTNRGDGRVPLYTEWGMRLPSMLISVGALCLLAYALTRTVGRRVAYATAFILGTMPLYFLLARQVITDTPFVATLIGAMSCAIIGLFDEETKHRSGWWYGFYIFCGLSTLAKELLGIALLAGTLILYAVLCVLPVDAESWGAHLRWLLKPSFRKAVRQGQARIPALFEQLYRIRFGTGILVFLAVAAPWLLTMTFSAQGRDPENETFLYRYFIHDQFARLTAGVHTTEHGTPFTYFFQQGGYAIFPWVALIPGALFVAARTRLRTLGAKAHIIWLAAIWAALAFFVVAASATKFPHYILPTLPALAMLMGFFVQELWDEGLARHAFALASGFVLFVLVGKDISGGPYRDGRSYAGIPTVTGGLKNFTDMITYNHDRPYPFDLVTRPIVLSSGHPLTMGHLFGVAMLAAGIYLVLATLRGRPRSGWQRLVGLVVGGAGMGLLISVGQRGQLPGGLSEVMNLPGVLGVGFTLAGALLLLSAAKGSRIWLYSTFSTFAVIWAVWFSWNHWVNMAHHWTQRDLFWRYYDNRKEGEPIAAYLMDWKGETFYSRNTVKQIPLAGADEKLAVYLALPGRKWVLVEQGDRMVHLQQLAGARPFRIYSRDLNIKVVLVSVD